MVVLRSGGPVRDRRQWPSPRGLLAAAMLAMGLVACGSTPPTPPAAGEPTGTPAPVRTPAAASVAATGPGTGPSGSPPPLPSGPPRLGLDWGRATVVERPPEAFPEVSPGASIAFSTGTGTSGHPLHFPGQAIMADVVVRPGGGLVAIGYVGPDWHPTAWTSRDAMTWTHRPISSTAFTFPVAMAVGRDGGLVAVGRQRGMPLAWTSSDGVAWANHPVAILGDGSVAERMTTVIATSDGFLAGGSLGPELFERHARFWRSTDGVTWTPVADDPTAFADAEVRAIVQTGRGYVAVGVTGSVQQVTGSIAWTSPDGETWTRHDAPDLALGRAVALVEAPFGGLVAVGSGLNEEEALAWRSEDGRTWTIAPDEASRQYAGKIRMTDVVAVDDAVIGVGNYVGLQRGTAVSWVSRDGLRWEEAPSAPIQEQVELYAVVDGGPGIVAVGSFGAPDDYIPTVLLSPGR